MFGTAQLISVEQAESISENLLDIQCFWLRRHRVFPFYTLGVTNYYDITGSDKANYYSRLAKFNALLLAEFGELYRLLKRVLSSLLRAPVSFSREHALPGFQLFQAHPDFHAAKMQTVTHSQWFERRYRTDCPRNPVHVDRVHQTLDWNHLQPDFNRTISFTLPLAIPPGAGLKLWPITAEDTQGISDAAMLQMFAGHSPQWVPYREGTLVCHDGNQYHQAQGFPVAPGEQRFTLQGHGCLCDGTWYLFW